MDSIQTLYRELQSLAIGERAVLTALLTSTLTGEQVDPVRVRDSMIKLGMTQRDLVQLAEQLRQPPADLDREKSALSPIAF